MSILLGLTTAFGWGTAAFLARYTSREQGAVSGMLFAQSVGLLVIIAYVVVTGELLRQMQTLVWYWWLIGLLAAGIHTFGLLMFYRAVEVGVLSLVVPIAATSTAFTVFLSLMSGERMIALNYVGMGVALVGVILIARRQHAPITDAASRDIVRGNLFALLSAMGIGVWFWVLGFQIAPRLGTSLPVMMVRLSAVLWVSLFFFVRGKATRIRFPTSIGWWVILGQSVLANGAFIVNVTAYQFGNVSTQSVFASMNSAVTIMWSVIFLQEKLRRSQWIGAALVLTGIVFLSVQV